MSASHQLTSVEISDCARITDASIESLYEATVAWGKRRNTKSQSMTRLVLRDNSALSMASLVFLSTAVPNLEVLDLRDCSGINLTKGMIQVSIRLSIRFKGSGSFSLYYCWHLI